MTLPVAALRILIVDDNADAAESLAMLLRLYGHVADTATDGPAALVIAVRDEPDVVILDIGMPGMSGYDVARQLLAGGPAHPPTVIAVSGYSNESARRKSTDAGMRTHLVKPVEGDVLLAILADVVPARTGPSQGVAFQQRHDGSPTG